MLNLARATLSEGIFDLRGPQECPILVRSSKKENSTESFWVFYFIRGYILARPIFKGPYAHALIRSGCTKIILLARYRYFFFLFSFCSPPGVLASEGLGAASGAAPSDQPSEG